MTMNARIAAAAGIVTRYHRDNPHIGQTLAAFAIKMVGALMSFGLTILIGQTFGATGVGQFGLAVTTLLIVSTVALCGLDYILIRTVAGDIKVGAPGKARGAIRTVALFTLINAVVLAVLLTLETHVGRWFGGDDAGLVLRVVTFGVIPFALIRVISSALRSCGHVLLAQVLDGPLSMALTIAAVLGWMVAGTAPTMAAVGIIYICAIAACVGVGALVHWRTVRSWGPAERVPLVPLLGQGWPILCVVLTGFFVDWLILVVLARTASAAEVGLFRSAWQVASIFNLMIVSFDAVAGPRIAAAHRIGDLAGMARTWRQAVWIILALSSPLFVLTLGFPEIVLGLFGPEFAGAADALRILSVAQLVNVLTGPIGSLMIMSGRERASLAIALAATALALVLALVLIPAYGLVGAALATGLTLIFRTGSAWILVRRKMRLSLLRG